MTRDEILNKSQQENKNGDERELQVNAKAGEIAFRGGGALCMIWVLIDHLIHDAYTIALPLFSLYAFMGAVSELYTGIVLRSKFKIILGIIYAAIFIGFVFLYVLECKGVL